MLQLAGLPEFHKPDGGPGERPDEAFRIMLGDGLPRPDLVVVSGNLARRGRKWEYDQALRYLAELAAAVDLPPRRVVLVPGEGDINREAAASYFLQRAAEDEEAEPPYWPKWTQFAAMFGRFYHDVADVSFAPGEPWSLFEQPDLKVIVAGVNSTMAHSHRDEDAYGLIGEQQAQWFQSRLPRYAGQGWLRIGVLRHGPAGSGGEELRDAELLDRLVAPHLNLVVHGANGGAGAGTPMFAAGPGGAALVRIAPEGLTRWTARNGGLVREELPAALDAVHATFPSAGPTPAPVETIQPGGRARRVEEFADRVKEICALRHGGATIVTVAATAKAPMYLRVSSVEDSFVTQRPVGLAENGVTERIIDQFVQHVHQDFAAADPYLVSEFVYSGAPADEVLVALARKRGVNLRSFVEYQGLMDLRSYLARQTERLENSRLYPPATYVPQRYRVIGTPGEVRAGLLEQVFSWMETDDQQFVLVLGDFGLGKTFLLQELARRMPERLPHLVPMLLELRTLEKARSVDELVAQHLAFSGEKRINLDAFRYMLRSGRIVLMFDGFDELALRVSYDRAADRLQTLLQGLEGRAKLVISSRSQHFMSTQQVLTALGERVERVRSSHLVELVDFTDEQIREYLIRLFGGDHRKADARLDLIREIRDLLGLSRNPRMLGFIANLDEARLRRVHAREGSISSADLYRELLDHWFRHEDWRASPRGATPVLTTDDRWRAVRALAMRLWQSIEWTVAVSELEEETAQALGPLAERFLDEDQAAQLVGSGTLLVRDDDGRFGFVHQSVLEWLIAAEAARQLQGPDRNPAVLGHRPISALMADFFAGLVGRGPAVEWARQVLDSVTASDVAKKNALLVQDRVGVQHATQARLSGQNLRGSLIAGNDFSEADLAGADLTSARLVQSDLSRASLRAAQFVGAALDRVRLVGADLAGADFSEARLVATDLSGTVLTGSRWTGASLINVTADPAALGGPELAEAAVAGRDPVVVQRPPAVAPARSVAFSPSGRLVAYGMGQTVVIAGPQGGRIHRTLSGHTGEITSVAFSPDGGLLASAGLDGTVRVWRTDDVTLRETFAEPTGPVQAVAFSPDGTLLAAGGEDGSLYLWRVANGVLHRTLGAEDAAGPGVTAVAFSPDGTLLTAAAADGLVRMWNVADGTRGRTLHVSARPVQALAFNADGTLLATGSGDGKARLWRVGDGALRDEIAAHIRVVLGVALSPDGTELATCGGDGLVRLWNVADGSVVANLSGHDDEVLAAAYSPDGDLLATAGTDGSVRIWTVSSHSGRFAFGGRQHDINDLAGTGDGRLLAAGTDDGRVRLWRVADGTSTVLHRDHTDGVFGVGFSPDGALVAVGGAKGTVQLRRLADGELHASPAGAPHGGPVRKLVFNHAGDLLATAAGEGRIRLWRVSDAARVNTLASPTRTVAGLAFTRDDRTLVVAGGDETIQLWNMDDGTWGQPLLTGRTRVVSALAFNGAGSLLASGGSDGTVQLWRYADRAHVATLAAHRGWVHSVAFSPDGTTFATAGQDETVRVWRTADGAPLATLTGHLGAVYDVTYCAGGLLASSGADGVVLLWRPPSPVPAATLVPFDQDGWATILPDGRYKLDGEPGEALWWAIKLCRYSPGQLDAPVDTSIRRLPVEAPVLW
ncbi:pentapeptide repeat-containing protein [Dactylosporangium sp. AC04546]|uniref:WD40 domain-containing protein n=1 Tax=Dactylosporangium sp. AC04546 TaxID=2862460 RepID=UPI001EDD5A55|nr:pentapeptide repeat-containing protein [Dactylosporangium sp. AC04546]WVK81327.1 pentapeptide repeat-containing protein [Dactylosporangium sp. AC04546]